MTSPYAAARRQHRDVDTERDLRALWRSERFEDPAKVAEALRVYEMAIRVDGWQAVSGWARDAIATRKILNAQLVELAMRALEQPDDAFFEEITAHLLATSPPSYFKFWHALFTARHSHRGERLFRSHLEKVSDFHVVKYRRWIRRVFRRLRFRCRTDRERAIGAIVFGMYEDYDRSSYPSEVFAAYIAAHAAASTRPNDTSAKPVTKALQAELFAEAAAPLRMWSIAEGIRTSARLPRTLKYLSVMAPTLSDVELLRALKAFDAQLATADHKKPSALVSDTAAHIAARLRAMTLPVEEWAKILPYPKSPVLTRLIEDVLGAALDVHIEAQRAEGFTALPVVEDGLDARRFRAAFVSAYVLQRAAPEASAYLAPNAAANTPYLRALDHESPLWPFGVGLEPPVARYRAEPDHPHRVGFDLVRELFPAAAQAKSATPRPLSVPRALRAHLHRRAIVHGGCLDGDVPVLFLAGPPAPEERAALTAILSMFSAAALILIEQEWREPLEGAGLLHLAAPGDVAGILQTIRERVWPFAAERRAVFAADKPSVDRAVRALLLGPVPPVTPITRAPRLD